MMKDGFDNESGDGMIADSDMAVARLLERSGSRPPKVNLSGDEKKELLRITRDNRQFRKLKDIIRLQAWARAAPLLNEAADDDPNFRVHFARMNGIRIGMLNAVDLLEELLIDSDDDSLGEDDGE